MGGGVLFNKTEQQNRRWDTSVLISHGKCQEDADNLICCHHIHEKGLGGDDDRKVCVCVCVCSVVFMHQLLFVCEIYVHTGENCVNVLLCMNCSSGISTCVLPAHLSICVCALPYYPRYGFSVSLTNWPDPAALLLFKPFKGDVFRIEDE